MNKYRVAIVGLGMVGLMYDHLSIPNKTIYGHSKAFSRRSGDFELYGIDPNSNAVDIFVGSGYGQGFTSLSELYSLEVDVYILAVETSLHYELASKISNLNPRMLLIEKPISYSIECSRDLVSNFHSRNIPIFVNYFRRALPKINELRDLIRMKAGEKCLCFVFYSGGVFNIASHFIDLLIYIFGNLVVESASVKKKLISDFTAEFFLKNEFVDASFIPLDVNYKFFEIQMYFDDLKITIDTFGVVNMFKKGNHPALNIDSYLVANGEVSVDDSIPQKYVVDNIYNYLTTGYGNLCSGFEALKTEELINQILIGG